MNCCRQILKHQLQQHMNLEPKMFIKFTKGSSDQVSEFNKWIGQKRSTVANVLTGWMERGRFPCFIGLNYYLGSVL